MSAAPERPAIVTLARRGEGMAWLQLGLWALLATSIVSSLATAMLIHDLVTSGLDRRAWVTEVHEVASLVSVMVQLFAGAGLLIGVVLWRREESDRATRGLLGLAAVVIGVGIAHDLASLYLTLAVRAEDVAHEDALRLMEYQRWSSIAGAVEWPAVFVALMTALGRMARARGQRIATSLLVTVALASLAPLGLMLLGAVGIEVPLSSPTSQVLMHLGISIVAVGGALLAVRRASRIDGPAGQEALPGGPGWQRAASGLDILVGALIARILLGLAAPLGMLLGLAESTPGAVTTATFLVAAIGELGALAAMVVGANRLRAAPEPSGARVASGAAALLCLVAFLVQGHAIRELISSPDQVGSRVAVLLVLGVSLVALAGTVALLTAMVSVARRFALDELAGRAARLSAWLAVVTIAAAFLNYRAMTMAWSASEEIEKAIVLPVIATVAMLALTVGLAGLARQLVTELRGVVRSDLPPARIEP